jgi:hypothetical protein
MKLKLKIKKRLKKYIFKKSQIFKLCEYFAQLKYFLFLILFFKKLYLSLSTDYTSKCLVNGQIVV